MPTADIRLALRNLRRNGQRALVAILTVASGVIAYLLAGGFVESIFDNMRETTIRSQLGHIQIVRPDYYSKGIADPYSYLLPSSIEAEKVNPENLPGIVSIASRMTFNGLISFGDLTVPFIGEGIDPVKEKPISARIRIVKGKDLESESEASILIGEGLANILGIQPGATVVLLVTTQKGRASAIEVKVAGLISAMYKDYDDMALRLPITLTRKLMQVDGATSWVVLLDRTDRTAQTATTLKQILHKDHFQVIPWNELADFYNKTVELFSKQVTVMKMIIGLIIVLTITNTLTMSVLERTTEIGTSLAVGLPARNVIRLFVIEGILIGVLGGIVGVILGYLLAMAISSIGIPMPPPPGMAHGYVGQIIVTPALALDAVLLALVTTLVASAFPAWKAGRLNIVDALRYSQ